MWKQGFFRVLTGMLIISSALAEAPPKNPWLAPSKDRPDPPEKPGIDLIDKASRFVQGGGFGVYSPAIKTDRLEIGPSFGRHEKGFVVGGVILYRFLKVTTPPAERFHGKPTIFRQPPQGRLQP